MRTRNIFGIRKLSVLLCVGLAACSDPGNTIGMAKQVADNFFQAVKNQDFEKAADFFEDAPNNPRGRWLAELRANNDKLGALQTFKLVDKEVDTVYSGTRYILVYNTEYAKQSARETLILFDGVSTFGGDDKNGMVIQGMVVKSRGL